MAANPYAPLRVIQQFVGRCSDCPHSMYYSGGMYECRLTKERLAPDARQDGVGDQCPLPYAGPPVAPMPRALEPVGEER